MTESFRYMTVEQIAADEKYPFTLPMMRHYLLHRHRNGLHKAVRKIGKRIFVRNDLLDAWIEESAFKGGV
jgi:hypothetical protein